ncbi:hypothetical protein ACVIGA_005651 [Bradyrhizobium sp. USDA 3240]
MSELFKGDNAWYSLITDTKHPAREWTRWRHGVQTTPGTACHLTPRPDASLKAPPHCSSCEDPQPDVAPRQNKEATPAFCV